MKFGYGIDIRFLSIDYLFTTKKQQSHSGGKLLLLFPKKNPSSKAVDSLSLPVKRQVIA